MKQIKLFLLTIIFSGFSLGVFSQAPGFSMVTTSEKIGKNWGVTTVTTTGSYAGNVRVKIECTPSNIASLIELQYWDDLAWQPLSTATSPVYFGPAAGFPFVSGNSSKFRTRSLSTTDETVSVTLTLVSSPGDVPVPGASVTLPGTVLGIAAGTDPLLSQTDFPLQIGCIWKNFSITSDANNSESLMVKGKIDITSGNASDVTVEYLESNGPQAGQWFALPFTGTTAEFGPSTGFPFSDATSQFRVKTNTSTQGNIGLTVSIVDAADPSVVVATLPLTSTVLADAAPIINSTLPATIGCSWSPFTVTTQAKCAATTMVIGKVKFTNASDADFVDVEYLETAGPLAGQWVSLPFTSGQSVFGPSAGFPFGDATSSFRVKSNASATTAVASVGLTVEIVDALAPATVIASQAFSTAIDAFVPSLLSVNGATFPTMIGCADFDFGIKSMANCWAGTMVKAKITLTDASQSTGVVKLQYDETYNSQGFTDLPFTGGVAYFGPSAGFPFTDDFVSDFRLINDNSTTSALTFAGATITIFAAGDASETALATLGVGSGMTVNPKATPVLTSTLPSEVTCDWSEFTVTSESNCATGAMVVGKVKFTNASDADLVDVEYKETAGSLAGQWVPLTFTSGQSVFGPSTGFPFGNATSSFRVKSKTTTATAGVDIEINIVDAATQATVIATETFTTDIAAMYLEAPTVTSLVGPYAGSVDLAAAVTNFNSNYTYTYYSDAAGTSVIASADAQAITVAGTYYVKASSTTCGESALSAITVTFLPCVPASIATDLSEIVACNGQRAVLRVQANDAESYEWYENGVLISGEGLDSLVISNAQANTTYQVKVLNSCQSIESRIVKLQIVNTLPDPLIFTEIPSVIHPNEVYNISVGNGTGDYAGVSEYRWSFSNDKVEVLPIDPMQAYRIKLIAGPVAESGRLTVTLDHVCGNRTVSQNIEFQDPTGIENVLPGSSVLYSNPVSDVLTINSASIVNAVYVLDLNGRLIHRSQPGSVSCSISASGWSKGTYIVRIVTVDSVVSGKIIKK